MSLEPDGKDFIVQTSSEEGPWTNVRHFADVFSAKQWAQHLLDSRKADSARVVQVRFAGWRSPADGTVRWTDDIGEREDNDR